VTPARREFEAHLKTCPECRNEVLGMQDISGLFDSLRPPESVEPAPGFYARLSERLEVSRRPSFWNLLSLDPAFGRRVAFASLLTLAVVGSYLVSRENEYASGPSSPETVMAIEQHHSDEGTGDRDMMLATLASYRP